MKVDVLSDVLRAVRLSGSVYFDFQLSSPWVVEAPRSRDIVDTLMPGSHRVIECHLMARGSGFAHAISQAPIRMEEGDLIVFAQGDAHVLTSTPGMRAAPDMSRFKRGMPLPTVCELGGGGPDRARIVCCFLGCDERPYNPLLAALPVAIHIAAADSRAKTGWLAALLGTAASEAASARAGGENIRARLSELVFVETIRLYLESLPESQTSWLAGLRDPVVGQALGALHGDPRSDWTVESLARMAGVSRSILAERFTEMVGHPPMQYLALWRMQLAASMLAEGRPVSAVARDVGYGSEAAFSRAFKKLVGETPTAWRDRGRKSREGLA